MNIPKIPLIVPEDKKIDLQKGLDRVVVGEPVHLATNEIEKDDKFDRAAEEYLRYTYMGKFYPVILDGEIISYHPDESSASAFRLNLVVAMVTEL